jgi:formylmethanofuran dehydrogenase subunit E-like metal-binding protein
MKDRSMKKSVMTGWACAVLFTMVCCSTAFALGFPETVSGAMKTLAVSKGDPGLLLMTNAPYVRIDGQIALPYLDQAQELTGCRVGKGNLLFFQRPQTNPLRLMLFKKTGGDAVIISRTDGAWLSETLNLSEAAISAPSFWDTVPREAKAGADISTLAVIANVWAKGGPYDFLKSAEFHNHICPGLTSGYMMAHYILHHYPLKEGERYTVVASPVWCKEDALQVILDCTAGKKGIVVKPLSKEQTDRISVANPAGFLLIWNDRDKTGKGVALSFDFNRLNALSPAGTPKAASVLAALKYLDQPDQFVSVSSEFDLNEKRYQDMIQAGGNPYEIAGLLKN